MKKIMQKSTLQHQQLASDPLLRIPQLTAPRLCQATASVAVRRC